MKLFEVTEQPALARWPRQVPERGRVRVDEHPSQLVDERAEQYDGQREEHGPSTKEGGERAERAAEGGEAGGPHDKCALTEVGGDEEKPEGISTRGLRGKSARLSRGPY